MYSLLISYALYQIVYVKLKYTENIYPNLDLLHKPFERYDRKNWNFLEMLLVGTL